MRLTAASKRVSARYRAGACILFLSRLQTVLEVRQTGEKSIRKKHSRKNTGAFELFSPRIEQRAVLQLFGGAVGDARDFRKQIFLVFYANHQRTDDARAELRMLNDDGRGAEKILKPLPSGIIHFDQVARALFHHDDA